MSNTQVSVTPSATSVAAGATFSVAISIIPGQAVAGAQMNLTFNPKAVQVVSVAEGNIFKAGETGGNVPYFMPGSIDNVGGAVNNIVDVITGASSVITPGTFVTLTCVAVTAGQTSAFNLTNVIVGSPAGAAVPLASPIINQIQVALLEDLNSDGIVNLADMQIVASLFGQTGAPGWIQADFLKAGVINVLDMILVGQSYT